MALTPGMANGDACLECGSDPRERSGKRVGWGNGIRSCGAMEPGLVQIEVGDGGQLWILGSTSIQPARPPTSAMTSQEGEEGGASATWIDAGSAGSGLDHIT